MLQLCLIFLCLRAAREAAMWELEERHLQEKHQLLKQQLKDQYFMQRHQLLKRHEKVRRGCCWFGLLGDLRRAQRNIVTFS